MTGYTKLFGSIVASTIWREPNEVRIVWITMLALANKSGIVEASVPGLADLSRVTVQQCRDAIDRLQSPDPDSRTPDHEGRRIQKVDGGWAVLNHAKYRAKMGVDERREYLRVKQAEHRASKKGSQQEVNNGQHKSTESTHTESDTQSKAPTSRQSKAEPSEEGLKFAEWFKTLLPATQSLAGNWRDEWARCYDSMLRLDGRDKAAVAAVCKWGREDEFWSANFQSPMKLRKRDTSGTMYFDIISGRMNGSAKNVRNSDHHIPSSAELDAR